MKAKAIVMQQVGGPDVLQFGEVDVLPPGAAQLTLRVLASGFNPVDTKIRSGIAPVAPDNGVLGCDVCGEIVEVGAGVSGFSVGDRVYGCVGGALQRGGSLAEMVTVDEALVALAPSNLSDAEVATVPVVGITAMQALCRLGVAMESTLFVLGASGGVGRYAVQLGRISGARVTGTAGGEERCDEVSALGVDVVDHSAVEGLIAENRRFSHVLDTVGGASFQNALQLAAPNAQVATINARNQYDLGQAHAKALTLHAIFSLVPLLTGQGMAEHGKALRRLTELFESGALQPSPVNTLPVQQVADVHRQYEERGLKQKVAFVWE